MEVRDGAPSCQLCFVLLSRLGQVGVCVVHLVYMCVAWRLEEDLPHAGLSCVASRLMLLSMCPSRG